jgi:DNA invertase Pin-like site-specific DNA recombinase
MTKVLALHASDFVSEKRQVSPGKLAFVNAGLRNARAKGKRLGRPRIAVDAAKIALLRAQGLSWPRIAREPGVSVGSFYAAGRSLSNNVTASGTASR